MQKVYTKIESIVGNVVTVRASGVRSGDLALVGESYASVIKLSGDLVSLQVFAGTQGVSTTDTVRFLGRPMMVSFSAALLGRVFDGAGVPRDNGPALTENMIPIGGPSVNPAKRIVPKRMIRTGIPMIDVFNTLVESQKLPIFSVSGEPYNQLLARIAMPYNTRYRYSADFEWCIRCLQHSRKNVYIPHTLINYLCEGATTAHRGRSLWERFRIMCRYYGTVPTVARHLRFIPRFLNNRRAMRSSHPQ